LPTTRVGDSWIKVDVGARTGLKRLSQRIAVALTCVLLAFAVLGGLAHAGGRYFYCDGMGLTQSDPCSVGHDDKASSERSACLLRSDCCESWTLPSMPAGTMAGHRTVAAPPLVAILAPPHLLFLQSVTSRGVALRSSEHWLRPPRLAAERRARLMVFLT